MARGSFFAILKYGGFENYQPIFRVTTFETLHLPFVLGSFAEDIGIRQYKIIVLHVEGHSNATLSKPFTRECQGNTRQVGQQSVRLVSVYVQVLNCTTCQCRLAYCGR